MTPRCGHPMRRAERDVPVLEDPVCGRPSGHPGRHRSETSVRTMRARRKAAYDRPTGSPAIAAKIREAREQAGASQSLLAAVLGVTQQCVHDWEKARRAPSEESWEQLARGLCSRCRSWHRTHGTIGDFGYVKADRMADYARLRLNGHDVGPAAALVGTSKRTAERYEAELRDAGLAPWREWEERRHAA